MVGTSNLGSWNGDWLDIPNSTLPKLTDVGSGNVPTQVSSSRSTLLSVTSRSGATRMIQWQKTIRAIPRCIYNMITRLYGWWYIYIYYIDVDVNRRWCTSTLDINDVYRGFIDHLCIDPHIPGYVVLLPPPLLRFSMWWLEKLVGSWGVWEGKTLGQNDGSWEFPKISKDPSLKL